MKEIKTLLSYIPQNNQEVTPRLPYELGEEIREELEQIIPEDTHKPYDMKKVISGICDADSFYEIHKDYAENIIVGFARLAGRSIGIIGCWMWTVPRKQPASRVSATVSTYRSWFL